MVFITHYKRTMLCKIEGDYQIYCFDIFDTIISRNIEPEHVKKIWSKEIKSLLNLSVTVNEVYSLRAQKEVELCHASEVKGMDMEFQYEELMKELYHEWKSELTITLATFRNLGIGIEMEIEKRVQVLCEDVVKQILDLEKRGKKIICISDFYMPSKCLKELLEFHGLGEAIDEVFVSSDVLLTKRSGRLYEYVIRQVSCSPQKMLMIGDNKVSDYENAIGKGMKGVWLNRKKQHLLYREYKSEIEKKIVSQEIKKIYSNINRNHYQDMIFSLYSFTEKLYYNLRTKQIKNVFFLSREGEYLKKIFDCYQEKRIVEPSGRIKTHYFIASRKSTLMPSLKPLGEEMFETIFRQYVNISIYDFLSSLGFNIEEIQNVANELGIDIKHRFSDFPRESVYQDLLKCTYFGVLYEKKRIDQKKNFRIYLNSFNLGEEECFCLVDVGWKGTIQDNIFNYFNEEREIFGMYLGLVAPGKIHDKNKKEGLVFQCIEGISQYFNVYNENKSIFEVILGASHGSANSYLLENGEIHVDMVEQREERDLFVNIIEPIQKEMFGNFKCLDESLIDLFFDLNDLNDAVADIHAKLVYTPTKEQMELFYNIYHYENFGVFEFTEFKKSKSVKLSKRVKNFKKLLKLRSRFFETSFWSVIALRDAGLSVLIKPYGFYRYRKFKKEGVYKR